MLDSHSLTRWDNNVRGIVELSQIKLDLDSSEFGLDAVLIDLEGAGREVSVQHRAVFQHLEVLGATIRYRRGDPNIFNRVDTDGRCYTRGYQ